MAASDAWIVPTLRTRAVRPGAGAQATAREDTLRRGVKTGIRYAAGTDSVGDEFTLHGAGNALEVELMGRALSPDAAGGGYAGGRTDAFDGETGTLEAGKCADLIAVPEDPRSDLSVLQQVAFVMRGGRVVRNDAVATGS